MAESNTLTPAGKLTPQKPYPEFPLFPHATGRWAKKIRGRFIYFGRIETDPDGKAAFALWQENEQALQADPRHNVKPKGRPGRPPRRRKPHPDFPLFHHATGYWAKKVRGKLHYFGKVASDPKGEAALSQWNEEKDDLLAGRTPRRKDDGALTIAALFNQFLTFKQDRVASGELDLRTWQDYFRACESVVDVLGKDTSVEGLTPEDFERLRRELAKGRSPVSLKNAITRIRVAFDWGFDSDRMTRPVRYGKAFDKPSKKVLLLARHKAGKKQFSREEILAILEAASVPMKAMILLAINTGIGNRDLARLPKADVAGGWLDSPRQKTAAARRAKLWPETAKAVQVASQQRPDPVDPEHSGLLFVTKYGQPWVTYTIVEPATGEEGERRECSKDAIAGEFQKLMKPMGVKRPGVGFYTLRRTYRTIADETKDTAAINLTMGHSDAANDMGAVYRQTIEDERLEAVAEYVRRWLFRGRESKAQTRKRAHGVAS